MFKRNIYIKRKMKRFKKKDLTERRHPKYVEPQEEETLDELVDADGSPIEGDRNVVSNSEIETSPGQTTDDFVQSARQPNQGYDNMFGGGTPYSRGGHYTMENQRAKDILLKILKEGK